MIIFDYSFARPDPAAMRDGVMRYLAPIGSYAWPQHSVGKVIGLDELHALWAAGKPVGLVWEYDTNDYARGYDGGVAWGQQARQMATTLGYPDGWPIYVAVDRRLDDSTRAAAVDYVRGFDDGANNGRPYGEALLLVNFGDRNWMPETWGLSQIDRGRLALIQLAHATEFDVEGCDTNTSDVSDWGGYLPGAVVPASPEPPTDFEEMLPWLLPTLL